MNEHLNHQRTQREPSINEQAVRWFTVMNNSTVSQEDQENFNQWHTQSPLHRSAFNNIAKVWDKTGFCDEVIAYRTDGEFAKNTASHRQVRKGIFAGVTAIAATALIAFVSILHTSDHTYLEENENYVYSTSIAELKDIDLPDGSELTLGPKSSLSFTQSNELRAVTLHHGRAFFDVRSMQNKPFIVSSGVNTVEVTGTEFEVSTYREVTQVSVVEGSVKVTGSGSHLNTAALTRGERVTAPLTGGKLSAVSTIEDDSAFSWMNNKLVFNDTPIDEFLLAIQPYVENTLILNGDNTETVTINTIVTPSNVHTLLDSLPAAYSLKMEKKHNEIIYTYKEK